VYLEQKREHEKEKQAKIRYLKNTAHDAYTIRQVNILKARKIRKEKYG